jgi:plasmid stabilization system protein ParE
LARLIYSGRALADLERLADFLIESDPPAAEETIGLIEEAVELRELVISRGRTGYVALYSFEEDRDAVLILALRHQREAGYWSMDDD